MTGPATGPERETRTATRLHVAGLVQGIGMRPAIARFAEQLGLAGYVGNSRNGVEVHVEGLPTVVARFESELRAHLPAAAEISSVRSMSATPKGLDSFFVHSSACANSDPLIEFEAQDRGSLSTIVPQDVVVCDQCLAEVREATDRRHGYGFTSCTVCGPRYSILKRMPYERRQTSMDEFPLCDRCREEYESPSNQRFHAQTNACPDCGPQVWLRNVNDQVVARGSHALNAATAAILDGRIVALRGVGGYQLLVDATSVDAVQRLRQRKRRHGKPLAVMVRSLQAAEELARLDETERRLLSSPAGPIVVATVRQDAGMAPSTLSGLNTIGLMLPTTPLHWLILNAAQRPLVCTSANVEGDPLVFIAKDALGQLRGIADYWLEHDRSIRRPIDDSVIRVVAGRPVSIRLARGMAPLSLRLEVDHPTIALGGHQKTSIAISNGAQTVLGPHVGDLETVATRERFVQHVTDMTNLYGADQCRWVSDQHPDYFTTTWAVEFDQNVIRVQHHHAHVVAGMVEHGWLDRQVLGVAFDGTGYGDEGTIWGGEFLLATATSFERVGHLRPFSLPGGERAVREPWRVATALVQDAMGDEAAAQLQFRTADTSELLPVIRNSKLSPRTSSAGRLFDGIAALVLGIERCDFEGQAAMLVEAACDGDEIDDSHWSMPTSIDSGNHGILIANTRPKQLDWRPLVRRIICQRVAGASPREMALGFHRALASAIFRCCRGYASLPVVLGGGVFQNRLLVELLANQFAAVDQRLGLPGIIPPNDGGLAAGQLAIAAALSRQPST